MKHVRWPASAALAIAVGLTAPPPAAAQTVDPDGAGVSHLNPGLRIYVGMWSTHVLDIGRGLKQNWLVGAGWRGYYGGTFINSFGDRSFVAGIQRTLVRGDSGAVVPAFGYRLGIVTGYDERFTRIARKVPVLPMAQIKGDFEMGRTGLEVGWAGLVASLVPTMSF
jgi:hypothetical protein